MQWSKQLEFKDLLWFVESYCAAGIFVKLFTF